MGPFCFSLPLTTASSQACHIEELALPGDLEPNSEQNAHSQPVDRLVSHNTEEEDPYFGCWAEGFLADFNDAQYQRCNDAFIGVENQAIQSVGDRG